ncbi:MAG: GNAT family N-acetyltransferase [Ruminococcus sp.]|nr:GNAT family N-acetyltransferase [Ruminococcus sp.]
MKQELCNIFCSCYPQFGMGVERFESLILGENTRVITHCENGLPLGFAVTEGADLRLICVDPTSQRRGIGSLLLEKAEEQVRAQGFEMLYTGGVSSKFLIGADKETAGFFEKKGFSAVGGCDEMLLHLKDYTFDERAFRGHLTAEYGWYKGSTEALHRAVAEVDSSWVQYYEEGSSVFAATVNGEIASFCLVNTDVTNYLSDAYGRVGMPGCVGTVPKFRDQGIGIEMIARVTQYLRDCGMDISFIYFTGVADWYKKLGYEIFMTEVFMQKQLG